MDYPILSKLYYKDRAKYEQEKINRVQSIAAKRLPMYIHGEPAYYMSCDEITRLIGDIYKDVLALKNLFRELPGIAYDSYAKSCLVDEVMLTNDLEGVRSTRKEINDILETDARGDEKKKRLEGMVRKYAKLLYDKEDKVDLSSCKGIRDLYDELVIQEIADEDLPDGKWFRKGPVSLVSATDKEKHRGIAPPESNIIDHMEKALGLLTDESIPPLVSIALLHYFIGYIHPFYDGNGRLSRFISSFLIKEQLETLTALRLSYVIKNNRKQYYAAFDLANDVKNAGDTTPFVITFLQLIFDAEEGLCEKIVHGMEKYHYYKDLLNKLEGSIDSKLLGVIFILIQDKLFGTGELSVPDLAKANNVSESGMRTKIEEIKVSPISDALIRSKKGHKYVYSVDLEVLEAKCNSAGKR